jgi:hypothetical protein
MDFGLAIKLSFEIRNKSDVIQSLSGDLKAYFENKKYGNDIKNYTIGIVCVSSKFDQFYKKEIKPKYTKGIKVISQDGIPFTLEDNFEYSIKIDFEGFKNADDQESKNILAKHILASLVVFEKMKSKINDFDVVSFKADLEDYFKSQKLNSY